MKFGIPMTVLSVLAVEQPKQNHVIIWRISLIINKHGRKEGRKGHSTMETQKGSLNLRALYEDGKTLNNVKLSKMDK